mmetsp:Transcript_66373/g.158811  ORF Transcript_66373/g.158811 Transcript_66373/m.158811 type:complete len:289 (-) Transcript_66373:124-990(-)|eukprot:CAMPEP_0178421956 /NCGR_PEP_ID=MMETSP0689_2-20121128/26920_1 /TAXON_ID=160604 /ORGANISM="Amphidinium massartii, Strain CS-259" /LENGTH=288 /DNA_ID=CAMNT_0020043495 /DNA_START=1 /DNA_END=867 /DNA_ORIENTATION=-
MMEEEPAAGCLPGQNAEENKQPHRVNWRLGYRTDTQFESEAGHHFFSNARGQVMREACSQAEEPESLQLGKELRKSHIQLSYAGGSLGISESKQRFRPLPFSKVPSCKAICQNNIDLAAGEAKSASGWQPVGRSDLSLGADQKFACKKPRAFEELGYELRKSSIPLNPTHGGARESESKMQFNQKPIYMQDSYGKTLGKELRTSHLDFGGSNRSAAGWRGLGTESMASGEPEKFSCTRPEGFDELGVQLRQTSIDLGRDKVEYTRASPIGLPVTRKRVVRHVRPGMKA